MGTGISRKTIQPPTRYYKDRNFELQSSTADHDKKEKEADGKETNRRRCEEEYGDGMSERGSFCRRKIMSSRKWTKVGR